LIRRPARRARRAVPLVDADVTHFVLWSLRVNKGRRCAALDSMVVLKGHAFHAARLAMTIPEVSALADSDSLTSRCLTIICTKAL
jgi:hypothetical protein